MSRAGSNMSPLWAPGFWVWLFFFYAAICKSSLGMNTASINNCHRKTCLGKACDVHKEVCCENRLHTGAGLLCCGSLAFHPEAATCCKVASGHNVTAHVTEGLSEKVSACCGLKAYNLLNELCCESSVVTRPSARARCCGKEAFDEETALCCGPIGNRTVLQRMSHHHQCCGREQYDAKTNCCCPLNTIPEIQPLNSRCCQQKALAVCGEKTYNSQSQLCCESTVEVKHSPDTECCGKGTFDKHRQMCCGPIGNKTILERNSSHHQCCGHDQYDTKTQCCCPIHETLHIRPLHDRCCQRSSALCGMKPYNTLNQLCCQLTVVSKYTPNTKCCDNKAFDEGREMCCGPIGNRAVLRRRSSHHQCCGRDQYDTDTQCCCLINNALEIHPFHSRCCQRSSDMKQQIPQLQPVCTKSQQMLGGTTCETDPAMSPIHCTSGQYDGTPTVYNPRTHIYCGGQVSRREPWRAQLDGSAGQYCCGTHVYRPNTEICCGGHKYQRHTREGNMHCCGTQAYSIQNQQMKCCAGTLYNLTQSVQSKLEVKCCGSLLQEPHHICCSSGEEEVLYTNMKGFRCCGHHHFNTSLWSCCAGKLHPVNQTAHHPDQIIKDVMLPSVYNLEGTHLCNGILLGTVESVSVHSVLFTDVLKICGKDGAVTPLPSPYIMPTPDCCSFLSLSPGKTYFYDENNVFADIKHKSTLQAIHFIISRCRRR